MRDAIEARLRRQTGHDVAWWNASIAAAGLDAVLATVAAFGPVDIQARKTYTSLLTPRRTFAAVKPTTRSRVDVALRLDGATPGGRLLDGSSTAGGMLNVRFAVASVDDLDDEAIGYLRQAYTAAADHRRATGTTAKLPRCC
jgi:hypothetical protein